MKQLTFNRRVGTAFVLALFLSLAIGAVAMVALHRVETSKNQITEYAARLALAENLRGVREKRSTEYRLYTQTHDVAHLTTLRLARTTFDQVLTDLRARGLPTEEAKMVDEIADADVGYRQQIDRNIATSDAQGPGVIPSNDATRAASTRLDRSVTTFVNSQSGKLNNASGDASRTASTAYNLVTILSAISVVAATTVAVLVTRSLSRQVGAAVDQVQTSAAELESSANQQATGAKEEAAAMAEITTTMSELLASSRQIADSAQRVSQIATTTVSAARSGEDTVNLAHESVLSMQQQVDLIVGHMLELGKKSQQIGAVLEIVSELAEQTNILAINATIEAASAGESGARFAVVADEIRNLADRVAGSAKEIRDLIDEVRAAVNTTVMVTETGSKTVQAGSKQFAAVTDSFRNIAGLLTTTTEAVREIELSTKQQATAVEQVNIGVNTVAQTTRETEASAGHTRRTAGELVSLSSQLLRLVRPKAHK
jgi:methyl-accepting chemotaxis protein